MTRDVLIIVLSIIALTIIFVVIVLFVSMNYTSFKNKIINRKGDELYKKDLLKQNNEFTYMVVNPELKNGFVDVNSYIGYARTNKDAKKVSFKHYYYLETDQERRKRAKSRKWKIVLSVIFYVLFITLIVVGIVNKINNNQIVIGDTTYVTIETGSMSYANESNTYLIEKDLTNQIPEKSFIGLNKVNNPSSLRLYDVAAYKSENGQLIVHRIIAEKVINGERYFTFRGDANELSDYYLVSENSVLYTFNGYINQPLGYFFSYLASYQSMVALLYAIIALSVIDYYDKKKKEVYFKYLPDTIYRLNQEEYVKALK